MSDDDRDSASEPGMSDNDFDDNDDADSDGAMDIAVADEGKEAEEEDNAECLSPSELIKAQLDAISEVNTIFQISAGTARILLEHFNWDKERLLERYYGGDQEKLFREANVINPETAQKQSAAASEPKHLTCEICYVDFLRKEMTGLECGHKFCEGCWNQYLQLKIMDEGTNTIRCPALGCNILVDELTVTRLITTPSVLKKYEYLAAKAFVRDNRHIKWCPAPGCENAIRLPIVDARPVACKCSHQFCFGCLQNAHTPLKCKVLAKWLKKCADDSETSNWMAANTKECPKCKSTIEKNGGCNHMTCKNSGCRYEFCWVCLGAWEPHGSSWYNCNRFDEKDSVDARDAQKKSRDSLERYLHYYNRFANHGQSRQLEKQLTKLVERKQSEMQAANHSWIEVQFLNTALQVLQECRNTLRYTYVFAYYLRKNNQGEIFESNQKDLEMATETLSGYLEGDASADGFAALRRNVMDKTKYCETRRKLLVQHVEEGYANGWWEYSVDMD